MHYLINRDILGWFFFLGNLVCGVLGLATGNLVQGLFNLSVAGFIFYRIPLMTLDNLAE